MRLTFLAPPGTTGPAVISPDGARLTFAAPSSSGGQVLWVRSLESDAAYPLVGTEGAAAPFWSADSRRIAYFADEKLKRVDATGGSVITICDAPRPGSGSWNARDEIIFAPAVLGPLYRVAATGGVPKALYDLDTGRGERAQTSPFFLPDGEHFVFSSLTSVSRDIFFGSLSDASTKLLARRSSGSHVAYTSGFLVYDRGNSLVAQRLDASRGVVGGEPITITDQGGRSFSVSAAGTLIFRPAPLQQLVWVDRSGRQIGLVGDPAPFRSQLSLSPDDTKAAIVLFEADSSYISIVDLARGTRRRFTLDPRADDAEPAWSPDGNQIAFSSNRNGVFDIYAKSISGEGGERLLFKSERHKYVKNWSRDGRFISFIDLSSSGATAAGNPRTDPWILPVAEPPKAFPYLTTDTFEDTNLFSSDGRWMAYISDETGQWELFVSTFPHSSAKWQISREPLPSFPEAFRWRRDGKEILYLTRDWTVMAVPVSTNKSFSAGEPKTLFNIGPSPAWDVTADGTRFLVAKPVGTADEVRFTVLTNWSSQFER
jgi:eukaryotic-like serine/threonine-protein kinase